MPATTIANELKNLEPSAQLNLNRTDLVENSLELLVQDHLRQLLLNLRLRQLDSLRNVLDLRTKKKHR